MSNIKAADISFENVVKFKYLGMSATIQSRIFSHCIPKNVKINPFPIQFKSLVPGQKSRVFSRDI